MHEIPVHGDLRASNQEVARLNRQHFGEHGVYVVNLMSGPGSGKTTLLEQTVQELARRWRIAVIEGDIQTSRDAERIARHGVTAIQINTKGACHLDARQIAAHVKRLNLDEVDLLFIENYKSTLKLKGGKVVEFRPLLPSDEFAYRNFFYSLQEKTIFMRFFYRVKIFSHELIQQQWASVDYRKNMSIIGLVQKGGHKEIVAIGSYAEAEPDQAEVAFVVREDYQKQGIGSYLLEFLENIAKENHYRGFAATVLSENTSMIRVFRKRYPKAKVATTGGEVTIQMDFTDAPADTHSQ